MKQSALPVTTVSLLAAAAVLGFAGDFLLRGDEWRLGLTLFVALAALALVLVGRRLTQQHYFLIGGLVMAGLGLVWRDVELLLVIDILSILSVAALLVWHGAGGDLTKFTVVSAIRSGIFTGLSTLGGGVGAMRDVATAHAGSEGAHRGRTRALVLGSVLAVPPLFIVTSLLASSDIVFDSVLARAASSLSFTGIGHLFTATLIAWATAGWMRGAVGSPVTIQTPEVRSPGLQFLSVAIPLGGLTLLLLVYLGTQARVLFGGEAFLRATAGLTVANYARTGFFQMIVASGIVLATLFAAQWALSDEDETGHLRYRLLGRVLLVLVSTLLVSAVVRIWLYVREFGLSVDRSFAIAGVVLVMAALIAFALTALRGRSVQFIPAMLGIVIAWVALLNVVNVEAIVVNVNTTRAARGLPFDAKFHGELSADAVPALQRTAARLSAADCQQLTSVMRGVWSDRLHAKDGSARDWRSMSLPLRRASDFLASGTLPCRGGA